jgi:hypothetical protein
MDRVTRDKSRRTAPIRWHGYRPFRLLSPVFCFLIPTFCLLLAGCRGLGKPDVQYDLLTAELRTRERELLECRAERDHLRLLAEAYQRQLQHQATPACPPGAAPALPLRDITLGTGTGGVGSDHLPGDESLMVVVIPRDADGTAIKVPARLAVLAYEVTPEGLKSPIGRWEVAPEDLRRTWRSGLLSSGYFVPLQWDRPPATNRLRIVARLMTLDGREYEADRDVTVRPLPGITPTPVAPPSSVPEAPPRVEELPPPTAGPAARLKPPMSLP